MKQYRENLMAIIEQAYQRKLQAQQLQAQQQQAIAILKANNAEIKSGWVVF